jgi:pSer/pThr/pTyr-binding forkhead associated (FHA) protein
MTDVSRRHCRFVFHDDVWTLVDLNSTNGTYVNNVRVSEVDLRAGDLIRIAGFEFEFPATPSRAADDLRTTQALVDPALHHRAA